MAQLCLPSRSSDGYPIDRETYAYAWRERAVMPGEISARHL